jgi:hypothetical protein
MRITLTSIINLPLPGPVFDNHGQLPNPWIYLNVRADHACILQCKGIIDIHVAGKTKSGIPDFYDGHLCRRYADDFFEALCECNLVIIWKDETNALTPSKEPSNHTDIFKLMP